MISEVLWRFRLPWGSEKMGDGRNTDVRKDQAFTQRRWYKLSCCAGILNLSLRGSEFLSECEPSSWHRRACYPGSKGTTRQRRSGARVRATRRCRFSSALLEFWSPGSKGTTGITCGTFRFRGSHQTTRRVGLACPEGHAQAWEDGCKLPLPAWSI